MLITLREIIAVASLAGFPTDKTALKRRLAKAGVTPIFGATRGGKCFLFPLERLPPPLRSQLSKRAGSEPTESAWGHIDAKAFDSAPNSLKARAIEKHACCVRVRSRVQSGDSDRVAFSAVALDTGKSASTIERAWKAVAKGEMPEELWLSALVPGYKGGRTRTEMHPELRSQFLTLALKTKLPATEAYRRVKAQSKQHGWGNIPSYKTMLRLIDNMHPADKVYYREGRDAYRQKTIPHHIRDYKRLPVLDTIFVDTRTADNFNIDETNKKFRPKWLVASDARTNKILSIRLVENENSFEVQLLIRDVCENYGIPNWIYIDNTKAMKAKALVAGMANYTGGVEYPSEPIGPLARVRIGIRRAAPHNGQEKNIEGIFGKLAKLEDDPAFRGAYVGRSPAHKPADYAASAVEPSEYQHWLSGVIAEFNSRPQPRSKITGGKSPDALFNELFSTTPIRKLSSAEKRILSCKVVMRKVRMNGEVAFGSGEDANLYFSETVRAHAGESVVVLYDPTNAEAPLHVETLDGRLIDDSVPWRELNGFHDEVGHRKTRELKKRVAKADAERREAAGLLSRAQLNRHRPGASATTIDDAKIITHNAFVPAAQKGREAAISKRPQSSPEALAEQLETLSYLARVTSG